MPADTIKIRTQLNGDICLVKSLIKHDMETGQRKDSKTGKLIPAHFIQELVCEHNGKAVLTAEWGTAISKNPFLSFEFSGAKTGDKFSIRWVDNLGESDHNEITI